MSKNEPPRPEDVACLRFPPGLEILGPIFEGKHTVPGIPLGASAESRKGARLIRPPRWATAIVPKWCMVRGAEAQTGAEGPQPLGVWVRIHSRNLVGLDQRVPTCGVRHKLAPIVLR
jgi:hypothetical protein